MTQFQEVTASLEISIQKSGFLTFAHPLRSIEHVYCGRGQVQVRIHTFFHISERDAAIVAIRLFVCLHAVQLHAIKAEWCL